MADLLKVVVTGASGRMGQTLVNLITRHNEIELVGALEHPKHQWIGQDIGVAMGGSALGVVVSEDPIKVIANAEAVIDFTTPSATVEFSKLAAQARAVHIIGTTGMSEDDLERIEAASFHSVIVRAGNMSLGVNLLVALTKKVAAALDSEFDIEIIEAHHNQKVDAPSGTALMLGKAAAKGRDISLAKSSERGRDGITGAREKGSIGFASIRGGDIVGKHDVLFASSGEQLTLSHNATDRNIFARGALKAALWGRDKEPGEYDMMDVLGLE
ncbi:MAG: 4-hydroxy-tetrahydrodipicolinate reductase [Paracoccaceae bacterium]|jgi:4-hydroxy-tetrahydrodipicolinate reductase|tara:strand:+ start:2070 stop:2882 length:813 start_codon:yes stop_codon:yes gene_type:complete